MATGDRVFPSLQTVRGEDDAGTRGRGDAERGDEGDEGDKGDEGDEGDKGDEGDEENFAFLIFNF
ncbi:MAG: hypothetical protein SWY16_22630 [Cyanobacteriota bacterium]|nr:hypothetical protein [Cyanobacteriota bacterium]